MSVICEKRISDRYLVFIAASRYFPARILLTCSSCWRCCRCSLGPTADLTSYIYTSEPLPQPRTTRLCNSGPGLASLGSKILDISTLSTDTMNMGGGGVSNNVTINAF